MATPKLANKIVILWKEETTPGVDAVPTKAVRCEKLDLKPLEQKTIDRKLMKPYFGSDPKVPVTKNSKMDFDVALAIGGDSAGTPIPGTTPEYDAILRACGLAKITTSSAVSGTAQGGTLTSIILASGASASDDAYSGLSISVDFLSGTAQDPGSVAKNVFKLAVTDKEHGGTLQTGSTTTVLNFASTASSEDEYYTGMTVVVASESKVISAYDGTTQAATLATALSGAPGTVVYTVQRIDNYFAGMQATIDHFSGTLVSAGVKVSTVSAVYLPLGVLGANNVKGCNIEVTTGANPVDVRPILNYDPATGKAILLGKLATTPTNASTFIVSEQREIIASDGTTKLCTLKYSLKFVTTSATHYSIGERRLIIDYNGTTKNAIVSRPFSKRPKDDTAYTFGKNIKYHPVSTGHISGSAYAYEDGTLYTFQYGRGNCVLDFSNGQLPLAKFSMTALPGNYEDTTFPAYDVSGYVEPLPVNYENTRDLIIGSFSDAVLESFSLDFGNTVTHLDAPGDQRVHIEDHAAKGSIKIWKPLKGDIDIYGLCDSGELTSLSFTHGPIGNQVSIFGKQVQLSNPQDSEANGIKFLTVDLTFIPSSAGSDDYAVILQ